MRIKSRTRLFTVKPNHITIARRVKWRGKVMYYVKHYDMTETVKHLGESLHRAANRPGFLRRFLLAA